MLISSCKTIWKCRVCGEIYGGAAEGGVTLYCKSCPKRMICDLDENMVKCDDDTLCWNMECWYKEIKKRYNKERYDNNKDLEEFDKD